MYQKYRTSYLLEKEKPLRERTQEHQAYKVYVSMPDKQKPRFDASKIENLLGC